MEIRNIKANLVSVNVEKLVQDGYIERQAVEKGPPQNGARSVRKSATGSETETKATAGVAERLMTGLNDEDQERSWRYIFSQMEKIWIRL